MHTLQECVAMGCLLSSQRCIRAHFGDPTARLYVQCTVLLQQAVSRTGSMCTQVICSNGQVNDSAWGMLKDCEAWHGRTAHSTTVQAGYNLKPAHTLCLSSMASTAKTHTVMTPDVDVHMAAAAP